MPIVPKTLDGFKHIECLGGFRRGGRLKLQARVSAKDRLDHLLLESVMGRFALPLGASSGHGKREQDWQGIPNAADLLGPPTLPEASLGIKIMEMPFPFFGTHSGPGLVGCTGEKRNREGLHK